MSFRDLAPFNFSPLLGDDEQLGPAAYTNMSNKKDTTFFCLPVAPDCRANKRGASLKGKTQRKKDFKVAITLTLVLVIKRLFQDL